MAIDGYTPDRVLPIMLEHLCQELGLQYQAYSDDWLLELSASQKSALVFGYTFPLNTSSAAEAAKDKVATYRLLHEASVSAVPHYLLRPLLNESVTEELIDSVVPADRWPVVVKPLEGAVVSTYILRIIYVSYMIMLLIEAILFGLHHR